MVETTIIKNGKEVKVMTGNQYQKAKDERKKIKTEHKLGFRKFKSSRKGKGERGGTIATIPIVDLNDEQFELLIKKTSTVVNWSYGKNGELIPEYILPERLRITKDTRKCLSSLSTLIGKELAMEVIAEKPDLKKIALMLDPMGEKLK